MKKILLLIGVAVISFIGLWLLRGGETPATKPVNPTPPKVIKTLPPTAAPRPNIADTMPEKKMIVGDLGHALDTALSSALGRKVTSKTAQTRQFGKWALTCGEPMEIGGAPVDYRRSKLSHLMSKSMLENRYCALTILANNQHKLVEFDLGSTDSPVLDWIAKHDIPRDLLSQDKKELRK